MSASRLAVSGAHSGGLATTVFPAARAGAIRQVASMSGAFHGVITAVTPDGAQDTARGGRRISSLPAVELAEPVGEEPEVLRRPRHHAAPVRAQQRAVVAASRPGPDPRPALSMPSAIACSTAAPLARRQSRPSRGRRAPAARTAAATSAAPPRRHLGHRLLVDRGQVGEGAAEATRGRRSSAGCRPPPRPRSLRSSPRAHRPSGPRHLRVRTARWSVCGPSCRQASCARRGRRLAPACGAGRLR